MKEEIKKKYIVVENIRETADVATLRLKLEENKPRENEHQDNIPPYCSGQFITIYFPELGTPEGKAYSISSAPHEDTLSITVKAMGVFSNRLVAMRRGDSITGSLPYGFFYSESTDSSLSMIASGIGIAPFRSMILDALMKNTSREIKLFYSVRTSGDILFKKNFAALEAKCPHFKVFYFVTRELQQEKKKKTPGMHVSYRRIQTNDVIAGDSNNNREFLMCGSISFVRDVWRGLRDNNVPEVSVYTEAFFSH